MNTGLAVASEWLVLLLLVTGPFLYLLPPIIAWERKHESRRSILILTVILGWTVLGWVGLVIWACSLPSSRTEPLVAASPRSVEKRALLEEPSLGIPAPVIISLANGVKILGPFVWDGSANADDLDKLKSWFREHQPTNWELRNPRPQLSAGR